MLEPRIGTEDMRVRVTRRGTVTLPRELRGDLPEGATLEVLVRDDGVIELRPTGTTDGSGDWFWSARWQAMEREADADFAAGRSKTFADAADFLNDLDASAGMPDDKPADGRP